AARAAAQPVRRGARAVGAREGSGAGRRVGSDARLARRGAARRDGAAASVHAGEHAQAARRARAAGAELRRRVARRARVGRRGGEAGAAVSEGTVIDSHTHLTSCEPPPEELVGEAERAGVRRMLTVGTDGDSCRAALAIAEDFPQVYVAIGRHPNHATGFDAADLAELAALVAHPRCRAIGETGLDFYRQTASKEDQERAFAAHMQLARATDKPLVIHTRAADDDTLAMLGDQAEDLRVILHCF